MSASTKREPEGAQLTQILYIDVDPSLNLEDENQAAGKIWAEILDLIQDSPGFQRLYWGRRLEEPEKVQLHTVRDTPDSHKSFLASPAFTQGLTNLIRRLTFALYLNLPPSTGAHATNLPPPPTAELPLNVRHAYLGTQVTLPHSPLGSKPMLGYPIGTAIYTGATDAWYEGAWPLWTHVVRHVDGCRGIAGGRVVEPVGGLADGYLVYVAWETVKHHDDYHHTKHFEKHRIILQLGHKGYAEYGHVVFKGVREAPKANL